MGLLDERLQSQSREQTTASGDGTALRHLAVRMTGVDEQYKDEQDQEQAEEEEEEEDRWNMEIRSVKLAATERVAHWKILEGSHRWFHHRLSIFLFYFNLHFNFFSFFFFLFFW